MEQPERRAKVRERGENQGRRYRISARAILPAAGQEGRPGDRRAPSAAAAAATVGFGFAGVGREKELGFCGGFGDRSFALCLADR